MEGGSPFKFVSSSLADPALVSRLRLPIGVRDVSKCSRITWKDHVECECLFLERTTLWHGVDFAATAGSGTFSLVGFACSVVVLFVSPLSASRSLRISLCSQWAAHVFSICGDSGLVYVEPADVSLEERLGCESSARCPLFLFFPQARIRSWCPGIFQLTACCRVRSCGVVPGRSYREARRDACAAKLRAAWPSDPAQAASVGAREEQEVVARGGVSGALALTSGTVSVSLFAGKR